MDYFLPSEIGGCTLALVGGSRLWRKSWSPALHQNLRLQSSSELNTSCSSPYVPLYFPAFFPSEILEWGWHWKSFSYAFLSCSALESWKCLFLFPKLCEYWDVTNLTYLRVGIWSKFAAFKVKQERWKWFKSIYLSHNFQIKFFSTMISGDT